MTEQKICQEVERTLGREICSTRDFEWLSQLLRQRIGEQVSASTLKRLWGYVPYDGEPRLSTLNTLARFIGYPSYAAFESTGQAAQSNLVLGKKVTSDDLRTGDRIRLAWAAQPPVRGAPFGQRALRGGAVGECQNQRGRHLQLPPLHPPRTALHR